MLLFVFYEVCVSFQICGHSLAREVLRWTSKITSLTIKHFSAECGLRIKECQHFVILKPPLPDPPPFSLVQWDHTHTPVQNACKLEPHTGGSMLGSCSHWMGGLRFPPPPLSKWTMTLDSSKINRRVYRCV